MADGAKMLDISIMNEPLYITSISGKHFEPPQTGGIVAGVSPEHKVR
jgi:hypothetical protein